MQSTKRPVEAQAYTESTWSSSCPNVITRLNGYDENAITYVPLVIIGAGESGIAMGCRLRQKLGFDQFRIFDRQAGVGGTWWINRYPGVACDVPAIFYSFSFAPNHGWTAFHPSGPEIVKYLDDVCTRFQITDKIQCDTDVQACRWIESEKMWEVKLRQMVPGTGDLSARARSKLIEEHGETAVYLRTETIRAKLVISAVGGLVEPNDFPEKIPGRDQFQGEIFHSARWKYDVDLKDKNIVVVGTGCSAAQFVPRLTKDYHAKKVTQVMRSPPWVVPRTVPPFGTKAWEKHSSSVFSNVPWASWIFRQLIFWSTEATFSQFGQSQKGIEAREQTEKELRKYIERTAPEKYHAMLTPDYSVGCKRKIYDATWFRGLHEERIELTTEPLQKVLARSVVLGPGQPYPKKVPKDEMSEREVEADVIILANGFNTTKWLHPLKVIGRDGNNLVETMEERGGPQAYQGTAMDGFPNFFMIFGPNTATGHSSVILASENMVEYTLKFVDKILRGEATTVEVKREAEQAYTTDIQRKLKDTVWASGGCASWYLTDNGWNGTVLPYSQVWFGLRCMFPRWSDWNIRYTRKGLIKMRLRQTLKVLLLATTIVITYAKTSGRGFGYLGILFKKYGNFSYHMRLGK